MMKNYFSPGSKSFKVIELLNEGKTRDEIAKTMGYKRKNSIATILSRWRKEDALAKTKLTDQRASLEDKSKLKPEDETSTDDKGIPLNPIPPLAIPQRVGNPQGTVVQIEGFAPGRTINLTPPNITMIQWFMNKYNWEGDLSDFLNQAVEDFFRSRNWRIEIVQRENLP